MNTMEMYSIKKFMGDEKCAKFQLENLKG